MTRGIYYIKNTIDEHNTAISGYFATQDEAMEALKSCNDWYNRKGTGTIDFQEYGLFGKTIKVYEVK